MARISVAKSRATLSGKCAAYRTRLQGGADVNLWPVASFSSDAEFGRYRGIADMAELVADFTQSRVTNLRQVRIFAVMHITLGT